MASKALTPMADIDAYEYELPRELIAQQPLRQRADARLLVVDRRSQTIQHWHVRDLPRLLSPRDTLVLNDTRVLPARLVGFRERTGGRWTGLFLSSDETGLWQVMSKTRGKLTAGETVVLQDRAGREALRLEMLADTGGGIWVARAAAEETAWQLLESVGRVPLPPYIRGGQMVDADREAYQTVYASRPGAIAAPTAGLHFTPALLDELRARGLAICRVTLHVGTGTFRPVAVRRLEEHAMHAEWGSIDAGTVQQLQRRRQLGGRTIAVGTTSIRVLETASRAGKLEPWQGQTRLFIRPPFEFHAADALMTNFHLPKTTLLILVRTFGGDQLIRRAYQVAIQERYRFYSYGDSMLIL